MHQRNVTTARERRGTEYQPPIVAELQAIFDTLPDKDLLALLRGPRRRGRRGYDVSVLWRCFVAYYALNLESVSVLIRYLRNNPYVASACGIRSPEEMPSQPTFSRFGTRLARRKPSLAVKAIQRALTQRLRDSLPGFGDYVAIDSTHMKGWSNGNRKGRRGDSAVRRQKPKIGQMSDPDAGWCVKTNTQGNKQFTWGYKAHILCDAVYELPIVVSITAGNVHDVNKATPLLRQFREYFRVNPKYVLADAGYSSERVRQAIRRQYKAVPVIDPHPSHKKAVERQERIPEWRTIYRRRTAVERLNSRMKAFYRLDSIRVRGKMKVALHALLSTVALEARALAHPMTPRHCVETAA